MSTGLRVTDATPLSALDRERVEDLFDGDVAEMRTFLDGAASTLLARCEYLASFYEREQLRELAHEIKGAALNVGAPALAAALLQVELELQTSLRVRPATIAAVLQACEAFADAVKRLGREERFA